MILSAVIFDLNGTIIEDEEIYGRAFNKILKDFGVDTKTDYPHEVGIGVSENWKKFIEKYRLKTDKTIEHLSMETQGEYLKRLDEVVIRGGFEEFATNIRESGIKIALATSNSWEVADKILMQINLQDFFDEITTGEEVLYKKPDPDLFIITADKLGIDRENCLVIEDAPSGITAAKRAGMKAVAIETPWAEDKKLEEADLIIEGFSEITPKAIDSL